MKRVALGVCLLAAAACGEPRAASGPPTAKPAPNRAAEESPIGRLERGLAARPDPTGSPRNPFRFGGGESRGSRRSDLPPLPSADSLPELPLPLAQPSLRLLGVSTLDDGIRVASILVGRDLVLAREGETLADRFRIGRVTDDAVEVIDAVGDRPMRLSLP